MRPPGPSGQTDRILPWRRLAKPFDSLNTYPSSPTGQAVTPKMHTTKCG